MSARHTIAHRSNAPRRRPWAEILGGFVLLSLVAARVAFGAAVRDSMPMPPPYGISYTYDAVEQSVARPIARSLDPARLVRRVSGKHREAANVDASDRVRLPSTWWQPRIGYKPVSVEAMKVGPGPGTGPAPGPWKVVKAKTEGVSSGFEFKDSQGHRFAAKFDAPHEPEMASSADVIASHLFWAAGYNVPDNTIATFKRSDLAIASDAKRTSGGQKVPLTEEWLDHLLKGIDTEPDGSYRVIVSRFLDGKPLGEWRYMGRRKGDVEDLVPHEHRRELRGLWPIAAWLNHTDCSARNTLDMYVKDGGRSFVRHYFLDFSGCLGSASITRQPLRAGHEYFVDYGAMSRSAVTLALPKADWENGVDPRLRGVGFVDAATFDADGWRPYIPNPAFDERTTRDIRWGARIVAAFPDELIREAVEMGELSDPRAREYLVRILVQRRDAIAREWLTPEEIEDVRSSAGPRSVVSADTSSSSARIDAVAPLDAEPAGPPVPGAGLAVSAASTSGEAPDTTLHSMDPAVVDSSGAFVVPRPEERRMGLGGKMRRAVSNFASDGWTVLTSPLRMRGPGLLWLGLAIGTEAVLYANDEKILQAIQRNREEPGFRTVVDVGTKVEPLGFMGNTNPYYFAAVGAGYALRVAPLREIPTEILESHAIAGGIRNVAKFLVGRRHPYEHMGSRSFDFGHGTSFPSGHTSVLFELATITSAHAHFLPYSIAAYSVATALAIQRVESENHWPSDVFIAAAYGTLTARTVVRLHRERTAERALGMSLGPWIDAHGQLAGLQLSSRF